MRCPRKKTKSKLFNKEHHCVHLLVTILSEDDLVKLMLLKGSHQRALVYLHTRVTIWNSHPTNLKYFLKGSSLVRKIWLHLPDSSSNLSAFSIFHDFEVNFPVLHISSMFWFLTSWYMNAIKWYCTLCYYRLSIFQTFVYISRFWYEKLRC